MRAVEMRVVMVLVQILAVGVVRKKRCTKDACGATLGTRLR